jgi:hypothetical protein
VTSLDQPSETLIQLRNLEQAFKNEVLNKLNIKVLGFVYQSSDEALDSTELASTGTYPQVSSLLSVYFTLSDHSVRV